MRRLVRLIHLAALLCAGPLFAADAPNQALTVDHIQPAYARLAAASAALRARVDAFCAAPGGDALNAVQHTHAPAFLAWQGVQHIRVGPVQLFMREFRFQLWPDKRGSVGRHLQRLIAEADPAALAPQRFATGSVAVQGFSAFEQLIHDPAMARFDDPGFAPRCRVLRAIAANLDSMAAELDRAWRIPEASAALAGDGTAALVAVHTQLERILTQKLDLPLGSDLAHARGRRAEAWRSGLSRAAIGENLAAVATVYRLALRPRLADAALGREIDAAFAVAHTALDALAMPLPAAVADPAARAQVEALRAAVSQLKALVSQRLAPALGLSLGFNSLDGD